MALCRWIRVAAVMTLLMAESESNISGCGLVPLNSRIVGGQDAAPGSWPWQVSINIGGTPICGGSLISNQWVLTAAQCLSFPAFLLPRLVLHLGRESQQGPNPNEITLPFGGFVVHPNYNFTSHNNDIALLRLPIPVNFTAFIAPVCLAASKSSFFSGVNGWVTGWGDVRFGVAAPPPQNLSEVEVPVVGNRECKCSYGEDSITENMMCAGLRAGGKDTCQGDGGGPLVFKQGGRWIQGGISSFGVGCAEPDFPGVYTRVSQYEAWINSIISSNQPGFITFASPGNSTDANFTCPSPTTAAPTQANLTAEQSTTPSTPVVCGQARLNSRIVGGSSVAGASEWPWMASLQKNGRHVCGGTLVDVDSVLSNAACFSDPPVASEWTVVLGRLKQNGSNPSEVSLRVSNISLSNLTGSNVAVLRLAARPPLTDRIQPICLDNGRSFPAGTRCWAAGWSSGRGGEEQILQEFPTTVQDCGTASTADSVCTGQFTLEQGDAGGPLMCKQDGSWFQAAVLSVRSSSRKKREVAVNVFEKLSRYQAFLTQTLGTFLSPASTTTPNPNSNSTVTNGDVPASAPFLSGLCVLILSTFSYLINM